MGSWIGSVLSLPPLSIDKTRIRDRSCYGESTYRNEDFGDQLAESIRLQGVLLWVFGWIPIIGNIAALFILNTAYFAVSTMDKWLVCQAIWGSQKYDMNFYETVWLPWGKDLNRYIDGGFFTQLFPLFSNGFNMVLA